MMKGSILVEFLVSFFLGTLLMLWLATLVATWYFHVDALMHSCSRSLAVYNALSCIIRDLAKAPYRVDEWKKQAVDCVIWHGVGADYGYELDGARLVRYEGLFDQGRWKKRTLSTVLAPVDVFTCAPVASEVGMEGAFITLKVHGRQYAFFTRCLGGERVLKDAQSKEQM
jgi:hypothetical protein